MDEQYVQKTGESTQTTLHNRNALNATGENPHPAPIPDHLIALQDSSWALWRWVGLRGAGFPLSRVLQLAPPGYADAVHQFFERKDEEEHRQQMLLQALLHEANAAVGKQRKLLFGACYKIKDRKLPAPSPQGISEETQGHFDAYVLARAACEQAWSEVQAQFEEVPTKIEEVLHEIARDKRFREAVMWQNRRAVHSGIDLFLRHVFKRDSSSKQRQHSQLIARYLQRYCTKNDSIGFFGPVGWARWVPNGPSLEAHPGPRLLATRTTYFETWCLDALGEALARDQSLLAWAVPRPMPFLFLQGTTLHIPFAGPLTLSQAQAAVFAACDGQRTAKKIAETLLHTPLHSFTREAEVFAILEQLRAARRIVWTFEVSAEEWHPELALRQQLEQISDDAARRTALAVLARLEEARERVAQAAGDVERLDQALDHLETTFTEITGKAANREEGQMYAARTLVYEDCRRDIEVQLGPSLLEELERPLSLLLTSARWFTYSAAHLYQAAFKEAYQELRRNSATSSVEFSAFWSWIQPLLPTDTTATLVKSLEMELQALWGTILAVPEGQWRVSYTSEQLRPHVEERFQAPHSGWPSACYHSPDILIAATGPEAIQRGDYTLVLGEFHLSLNTLDLMLLVSQHPAPAELFQAVAADLPAPRVVPVFSKHTLRGKRTHATLTLPEYLRFISAIDTCGIPSAQALRLGALLVDEVAGKLVARTRDGRHQFTLLELLDGILSIQVCDGFKLLSASAHTPRVTIDRLVISRESWRFASTELPFAFTNDALECYVGTRQWAREQGLPRFVFVRTSTERKPYYIDLESPMFVEILAKAIRQSHVAA
ncbi:MAG TPA: lantibiotic dehydratase, partial [Ktedonobacteraceae bacterium]